MDNYIHTLSGWTRDGSPAYPTWPERVYFLLRNESETSLVRRFRGKRFTEREIRSLLALRSAAACSSFAEFDSFFRSSITAAPEDYPPVMRPRKASPRLVAARRAEYAELLRGKRVVVVGPASSIVRSQGGALIESYDLVVRLNFQWPCPVALRADIGQRIDILYHCCNGDKEIESLFGSDFSTAVKFVCWQFSVDSPKLEQYCERAGIPNLDVSPVYEELLVSMQAFPHTGAVAIWHLLQHQIEELYITGISFYQDPYYPGYFARGRADYDAFRSGRLSRIDIHQVAPQLDWFKRLCTLEPRLRLDERLAAIVSDSGN